MAVKMRLKRMGEAKENQEKSLLTRENDKAKGKNKSIKKYREKK